MAVAPLSEFRLVAGSRRLIGLRWLLAILAALPGWTIGRQGLIHAVGTRPYFTDAPDPLPLPQWTALIGAIPGPMWGALLAGLMLAWLGRFMLTAAAVEILDPAGPGPVRVWRTVFDQGVKYVLPYLRVAVVSCLLLAVGAVFAGIAFGVIEGVGKDRDWTARAMYIDTPLWLSLVFLAWAGCVGVYAFWARVLLVADNRRSVIRLFPVLFGLMLRRPFAFLAFHWVLSVASLALAANVLTAWRQSPSGGSGWFVLWLGVLLLQAYVWHWRLRACRLVWAEASPTPGIAGRGGS